MTICDYSDRLEIQNGLLVRIVTATARKDKTKNLDVYKQFENGDCFCRNLYYSLFGYRVGFPDETNSLYRKGYLGFVQKLEDYDECSEIKSFFSRNISDDEKLSVATFYPDFKYIFKKTDLTIRDTLAALAIWKNHREIEYILAAGFKRVALNKSFWKLTEAKQKPVCDFMRKNPQWKNYSLADIQTAIRFRIGREDFNIYKDFCFMNRNVSYDVYKYLCKIGKDNIGGVFLYRDYKALLLQTSHNAKDEYWLYPKDLQKKHDELREEVRRKNDLEEIERLKKKQNDYVEAVRNLFKFSAKIDGYSVYVPETIEDIKLQAEKLNQCLIQCDYVSQVINKSCVLVFIRKNEEPVATVQLLSGDRIGQFYANELDRDNCLPTDEVRTVFNKWLDWKKSIRKVA